MDKKTYLGILEVNESVFSIEYDSNYIYASTACNAGSIEHYKQELDDCFSLDENLQSFYEYMEEQELNI